MKKTIILLLLGMSTVACTAQTFEDIAATAGLIGGYGDPMFFGGGGVSFVDFNQDGLDDLTFCTNAGTQLQFYLNNGDSTFTLVDPPYIVDTGESRQAIWVDFDGDDDKDLFVTAYNAPNRLYLNTGGLTLVDVTTDAGLPLLDEYTYGANFGDIDLDGDLDLYICNYGPPWDGDENYLYLNNSDGTFTDITTVLTANGIKQTYTSTFLDYNLDGWQDLYVVNDRHIWPNALLEGGPGGVFTDVSAASGTDLGHLAMNGGVADFDNNGYPDIYVTTNDTAFLFQNQGNGTFAEVAGTSGVYFERFGWGGNFFDFDNDLDLDLYVCSALSNFINPNALYVQTAPGMFDEPLRYTGGLASADTAHSYCNAIGDLDNDGWEDIAVCNGYGYDFYLWHNRNATENNANWIKVQLKGTFSNPEAIGTRVVFWVNDTAYTRYTHISNAYMAQNSATLNFGMGSYDQLDSLVIYWPYPCGSDGYTKQLIPGNLVHINALNVFAEDCACPVPRTYQVLSTANDGAWTLRHLVANACAGDTVRLSSQLAGDTVSLTGSSIEFSNNIYIEGNPADSIVIRFTDVSSAWAIPSGVHIRITGVELLDDASAPSNPTIYNAGQLTLQDVILTNSSLPGPGSSFIQSTGVLIHHGVIEIRQQ